MRKRDLVLPLLLISLVSVPGRAQESDPAAQEEAAEPAWSGSVGLSYLATGGNSDNESFGVDVAAKRLPKTWGLEFDASLHRAEQNGEKTAEHYYVGLRGTRKLAERWHAFGGLSAEKDEFAGHDLRAIVEAGATYKALLGDRHTLDLDFAVTWTDEQRLPPAIDDSWLGGLLGASYQLAISDNATFSQDLKYSANFEDTGSWRLDSLTALTAALNKRLAVKISHEIRYRNEPIGASDDTDTTTKASLVWNL